MFKSVTILKIRNLQIYKYKIGIKLESYTKMLCQRYLHFYIAIIHLSVRYGRQKI